MSVEAITDRPPYIKFEMREKEDRNETIAKGHYVAKDVAIVIITRPGSKDDLHKEASDWLLEMKEKNRKNEIPPTWYPGFQAMYDSWLKGETAEVNGIPIKGCTFLSSGAQKTLLAAGILTVEDLAHIPDSEVSVIGTGAMSYKIKAKAFLEQANGPGKAAEKMAEMQVKLDEMTKLVREQAAAIASLKPAAAVKTGI